MCIRDRMNSKDRKIVFFDIDGTIVDGATHTIPESTVEAIRRLRANEMCIRDRNKTTRNFIRTTAAA